MGETVTFSILSVDFTSYIGEILDLQLFTLISQFLGPYSGFSQIHNIGNNANIGISGFTT